ncbi:MAG: fructose-bisphosphate aldolase, partial [Chloroherpetonaceae bacterium]
MFEKIIEYLGNKSDYLLNFKEPKISKDMLTLPSPDFMDKVFMNSDRNNRVMQNLSRFFNTGRLAGTGYMSLLPVDQGVEHSAGA